MAGNIALYGESACGSGDNAAARRLYEAVVVGETARYGAEHEETLLSRSNLAITLEALGEVAAARREYDAVLAGQSAALGARHPHTRRKQLAVLLYHKLGERGRAWR